MYQRIRALAACVAIALAAAATAPSLAPIAHAAESSPAAETSKATTKKPRVKTYQFTGVIVEMDKSSLTVRKGKKKVTTKVFSKYEKMRVKGEVEKGARVTVYYRKQGEESVAHRVVVKEEASKEG
jgi:hypothetical protein